MGHTPYGYRIENGCAVIDEEAAEKIRRLYENYLAGMSLKQAATEAGIETYHSSAKRLPIIDQETFDKAEAIRLERAGKLGRLNRVKIQKEIKAPTYFHMAEAEQHYDDPRLQAEYLYSLIESEVI